MRELHNKLGDFKELILDDIKDIKEIASRHRNLDDFKKEIQQKTDLDLQEYLFQQYQQHSYNLPYEIEPKEGVDFISADCSLTVSDIHLSEDDHLEQVVAKFVYKSFEEKINEFIEQVEDNQFDLLFQRVQAEKMANKLNNMD